MENPAIERLARIACAARGIDPDRIDAFNPRPAWMVWANTVRAILTALREPLAADCDAEAASADPDESMLENGRAVLSFLDHILTPSKTEDAA